MKSATNGDYKKKFARNYEQLKKYNVEEAFC